MTLLKERPNVWFTPNLGGMNRETAPGGGRPRWADEPILYETMRRTSSSGGSTCWRGRRRGRGATRHAPGISRTRRSSKQRAYGLRWEATAAGDSNRWIGLTAHMELENFVAAGFTPAEAIVAATRTAADVLRLNQLGTVATGKSADFIVLDANPLDNIANTRRINKVYLRGQEVDRPALRAKWQAQSRRTASTE